KDITEQTCAAYGAKATVEIPAGYPSLYNNPGLTAKAQNWANDYLGAENVRTLDMRMAGEDFSFYTHHVPGCFFRIGTNKNDKEFTAPVHNAHFDIDEDAMQTGVGLLCWIAINNLS